MATTIGKSRKILILALSGTAVAVVIAVLLAVNASQRSHQQAEPVPNIVVAYDGKKYNGTLENYRWQDRLPPPNMHLPNILTLANVTKGDSIEFVAINASRQPNYYVVPAWDATGSGLSKTLFEDRRIDGNSLVIDWKEGREYGMYVTAIWVRTDLFGQQSMDRVSYRYGPVYVTG